MADLSAMLCARKRRTGWSIAHALSAWLELRDLGGVWQVFHHHCMFPGCEHRKYQCVYTNMLEVRVEIERLCSSDKICSRTGRPHASWEHETKNGRLVKVSTSQLAEYPIGYGEAVARGIVLCAGCTRKYSFIEVHCGKNAPPTAAVAKEIDRFNGNALLSPLLSVEAVPDLSPQLQAASTTLAPPSASEAQQHNLGKEPTRYQLADLASGRQPKWNTHSAYPRWHQRPHEASADGEGADASFFD